MRLWGLPLRTGGLLHNGARHGRVRALLCCSSHLPASRERCIDQQNEDKRGADNAASWLAVFLAICEVIAAECRPALLLRVA